MSDDTTRHSMFSHNRLTECAQVHTGCLRATCVTHSFNRRDSKDDEQWQYSRRIEACKRHMIKKFA